MNTQTHVIMGAALMGRAVPRRAWAGAIGGLTPDLPMLLIVTTLKLMGVETYKIFEELYWQNWWQICNAVGHNFWLWSGLAALGLIMRDRTSASASSFDRWTGVSLFAASALLHSAVDFLCHREDAHMSLWPVTRWKFMSPVSYYDPQHYGMWFSSFEAILGFALAVVLFRQFKNRLLRMSVAIAMALYVAVPVFFILM
jgi:membrane-bound metal-dependent hydrolase YbcI (DUF457 family)